jgi:vacuolar-type H+-ATPase subunit I/STV1
MATNSERELLEILVKKVSDSSALNGGFEKLCVMIEHVQEEQTKSGVKLDKVSEALYDPNTGLFSRVKAIESKLDTNIKDLDKKCDELPTVKEEVQDLKKFQAAIESIAGKQLEELTALVNLRKRLANIYWALALSVLAFVGNLLFQLAKRT